METPKVIYLIDEGDQVTWGSDPNPSGDEHPEDVEKYIRADVFDIILKAVDLRLGVAHTEVTYAKLAIKRILEKGFEDH